MKKKAGLLFFALGIVVGLLGNFASRKLSDAKFLPDDLLEGDDWIN